MVIKVIGDSDEPEGFRKAQQLTLEHEDTWHSCIVSFYFFSRGASYLGNTLHCGNFLCFLL